MRRLPRHPDTARAQARAGARRAVLAGFVVVGLAALATAASSTPAQAADGDVSIAHVEPGRSEVQLLVSVPTSADVDLSDVTVTLDGQPTETSAETAGATTEVRRTAVLVIDTSNSMRGERFDAAKAAAQTFLDTVPDDVRVGIVTFAGSVTEPLQPTLDRELARRSLEGLSLGPQTRLYDGVLAGIRMAGSEGQRSLLVLSDGADTSDTELDVVTRAVESSEVMLDVASLEQSGPAQEALEAMAGAAGGTVINATPGALRDAFTREADVLANQVLVTAQLPDGLADSEAAIELALGTDEGMLTAEAFAKVRPRQAAQAREPEAVPPPREPGRTIPTTWLYAGLAALGVGLLVLLLTLVPQPPRPLSPAERAALYTERLSGRSAAMAGAPQQDQALAQAKGAAGKVLERNRSLEARISQRLDGAGSPLKPPEWLLLHAAIFIGAGLVGLLVGKGSLVTGVVFLALGALGPWVFLGLKRSRRRKAFGTALPDTLQLMSGSLAAGLSLAQSVDTIVREGVDPISSEFKRVLIETRLGVSLEDALEDVGERFDSKDFGWVVMAIKIQRQVGGNLSELLNTVAATMREREYMRRQVAALAAEGKMSAWVLGGLPPAFMLYLFMTNREYVIVMFTEPVGWAMLAGAVTLLGLGVLWMSRLAKVEV